MVIIIVMNKLDKRIIMETLHTQTKAFTIKLLNDLYEEGCLRIPAGYIDPEYTSGTIKKLKLGIAQDMIYAIEHDNNTGDIEIISNCVLTPLLNYYRTMSNDVRDKRRFGLSTVNICLLDPRSSEYAEIFRNLALCHNF
jgi:hypothetical protein